MQSSNCMPGQRFSVNGLMRLLVARNGSRLPTSESGSSLQSMEDWDLAVQQDQRLNKHLSDAFSAQILFGQALQERRALLERDTKKLQGFPELGLYTPALADSLHQQQEMEQQYEKLHRFCASYKEASPEGLEIIAEKQTRLSQRLQECFEQDTSELKAFREHCVKIEQCQWEKLVAFNKKGQGQLSLQMSYETLRIDL